MFVYGDVVILKIGRYWPWKTVIASSHLHMPVRPTLLHRMALVSFLLFRKNLGNLREFLGKWFTAPPPLAKNCPYAYACGNLEIQFHPRWWKLHCSWSIPYLFFFRITWQAIQDNVTNKGNKGRKLSISRPMPNFVKVGRWCVIRSLN